MNAWDYPVFVVAAFVASAGFAAWLLRAGKSRPEPDFLCDVCGRSQQGLYARQWRYCPYCGTPRPRKPEPWM